MKKTKTILSLILALLLTLGAVLTGCGKGQEDSSSADDISVKDLGIEHETEFGGIYVKMTIDEFNKKGFVYGDSVDVEFSNGYKLEDIPYYNGYYVDAGDPLLIAYPGYDYIKVAINYGEDLWDKAGLSDGLLAIKPALRGTERDLIKLGDLKDNVTVKITRKEKGKYADIQAARDIHYTDIREEYPSDEVFANFRNMTVGNLKAGAVYRSASPCDNQHNRAPYVDALMKEAGVNCILDLADNQQKIENYIRKDDFNSPYFLELKQNGKVIPLALNMNYLSEDFRVKIAEGFKVLASSDGPYLVHCTEGKDRTGFVCMLIEALTGATYQEIVDDYMLTYDNYYEISTTKQREKYDVILDKNLNEMLRYLINDDSATAEDLAKADLQEKAIAFLVDSGMTKKQIVSLVQKITEAVSFIAPVTAYPGEFEMEAMASGAARVLDGEEELKEYTGLLNWDKADFMG